MKTAGIAVDNWKVACFKRHLDAAGYKYEELPGLTKGSTLLRTEYEWLKDLKPVVDAAMAECELNRRVWANG